MSSDTELLESYYTRNARNYQQRADNSLGYSMCSGPTNLNTTFSTYEPSCEIMQSPLNRTPSGMFYSSLPRDAINIQHENRTPMEKFKSPLQRGRPDFSIASNETEREIENFKRNRIQKTDQLLEDLKRNDSLRRISYRDSFKENDRNGTNILRDISNNLNTMKSSSKSLEKFKMDSNNPFENENMNSKPISDTFQSDFSRSRAMINNENIETTALLNKILSSVLEIVPNYEQRLLEKTPIQSTTLSPYSGKIAESPQVFSAQARNSYTRTSNKSSFLAYEKLEPFSYIPPKKNLASACCQTDLDDYLDFSSRNSLTKKYLSEPYLEDSPNNLRTNERMSSTTSTTNETHDDFRKNDRKLVTSNYKSILKTSNYSSNNSNPSSSRPPRVSFKGHSEVLISYDNQDDFAEKIHESRNLSISHDVNQPQIGRAEYDRINQKSYEDIENINPNLVNHSSNVADGYASNKEHSRLQSFSDIHNDYSEDYSLSIMKNSTTPTGAQRFLESRIIYDSGSKKNHSREIDNGSVLKEKDYPDLPNLHNNEANSKKVDNKPRIFLNNNLNLDEYLQNVQRESEKIIQSIEKENTNGSIWMDVAFCQENEINSLVKTYTI